MRSVWFVCVFASAGLGSFLPNSALAQVGDTLQLFQIEICAPIVAFEQVGDFVQFASLEYKEIQSSMGSYLQRNSNLSLRSYGPGSSIGLSIRGSSSAQSQVSLNGLNFDNPGLAQADLSLLPQGIFGSYKLLRGSGGAYLGNAAIGGCLMLDLPIDTVESLQLETGIGSFGQIDFSVKAAYRFGKTQHVTSLYRNASDNDFDRKNPLIQNELEAQPNAKYLSKGLAHSIRLDFNASSSAYIFAWYGAVDRQLPPNISKPISHESQEDQLARVQTGINSRWAGIDWDGDVGFNWGELNYDNPELGPTDHSAYTTFQAKLKASRTVKWVSFFGTLQYQGSRAQTSSYDKDHLRKSPSVNIGLRQDFWNSKLVYSISIRQEWLNSVALRPLPHLGLEWNIDERFKLRGNAGRAFRLPGLNDLYWNPGGNPDLKPESGWFQELGLHFANKRQDQEFHISLSAFNRIINNWIIWQPGPVYWSPVNIDAVHTSGLEFIGNWFIQSHRFNFEQNLEITYVNARNLNEQKEGSSAYAQLIYTPDWTGYYRQNWSFLKERIAPSFTLRFQSERYTTADNSKWLEPFFLLDLAVGTKISVRQQVMSLRFTVVNATDQTYQLQASHPMPGRQFQLSLILQITKSSTQKKQHE